MSNVAIIIKPIKAKFGNPDEVYKAVMEVNHREGERIKNDLRKTVATWAEKPNFSYSSEFRNGDAVMAVGVAGDTHAAQIWTYLEEGTRMRWAVMSKNWASKTTPGGWEAGAGSGKAIIRGRAAMTKRGIGPRPGIQARRWIDTTVKRNRSRYREAMEKAIIESTRKALGLT